MNIQDRLLKIVSKLKKKADTYLSGQSFADEFNLSRAMLHKDINRIRSMGYKIDGTPSQGYILKKTPVDLCDLEFIQFRKSKLLGKKYFFLNKVDTTHIFAKNFARNNINDIGMDGTIVVSKCQSAAIGRMGRSWASPEGGLWLSVILRPKIPLYDLSKFGLAAAVCAVKTLSDYNIKANIKWPNDIIVNEKKIAGILMEASGETDSIDFLVLSIGINVNINISALPTEIQKQSTSTIKELCREINLNKFLAVFLLNLEEYYIDFPNNWSIIKKEFGRYDSVLNKEVTVSTGNKSLTGKAAGIDDDGHLILDSAEGLVNISSGEIKTKVKYVTGD